MSKGEAARIRERLGHPVLDGDGHWIESLPVLLDYVRDAGGADIARHYADMLTRSGEWYRASRDERMQKRLRRANWWITTANTLDFATGMLPGLLVDRMAR